MFQIEVVPSRVINGMVVRLIGDAGVDGGEQIELALGPVTAARPLAVVLDLKHLGFINSLGLGALVRFNGAVKLHGGHVFAGGAHEHVKEVLDKTRMGALITICKTVEEAMDAAERSAMA